MAASFTHLGTTSPSGVSNSKFHSSGLQSLKFHLLSSPFSFPIGSLACSSISTVYSCSRCFKFLFGLSCSFDDFNR